MEKTWIEMRQLGRDVAQQARQAQQSTADAKERMDRRFLALQNLIYEKQHLELELAQCRDLTCVFMMPFNDIRTIYQNIPLVSIDEFMALAPEDLRSPDLSEHQLMLNRLQFELDERKRFAIHLIFIKLARGIGTRN